MTDQSRRLVCQGESVLGEALAFPHRTSLPQGAYNSYYSVLPVNYAHRSSSRTHTTILSPKIVHNMLSKW